MKKGLLIAGAVLIAVLIAAAIYVNPLLEIITGYGAKGMASGIFLSQREPESIAENELDFSFIKYNQYNVDRKAGTVTAKFLWGKSTALYKDGYGCTVIRDFPADELRARPNIDPAKFSDYSANAYWPKGDRVHVSRFPEVNYNTLHNAVNAAFGDQPPYFGTRAVIVVYKDRIIAEKYADGFNKDMPLLSWSMAKSMTNALVGIMKKDGLIKSVKNPLPVKEWQNDRRKNITWNDMMHMSSGQEWNENYGNLSDVTVMLHKVGDFGLYTLKKPLEDSIGTVWNYSSGSPNVLCRVMKDYFETERDYYEYPYRKLFGPLGMSSAIFETDASGIFVGSSYVYATTRDYARFAMLYLNKGWWLGQQILPEGWTDYSSTPAAASAGRYASYFWHNKAQDLLPDVPTDCYYCRGHDGQRIFIIPSKDMAVVRLGYSPKGSFDFNLFMKNILNAIE